MRPNKRKQWGVYREKSSSYTLFNAKNDFVGGRDPYLFQSPQEAQRDVDACNKLHNGHTYSAKKYPFRTEQP